MLFPLLLFLYFCMYSGFHWLLPGAHIIRVLIILLAVLWLFSGNKIIHNRLLHLLFLFIPVMLISIPGSYLKSFSVALSIGYLKILVIAFLTAQIIDTRKKLVAFLAMLLVVHIYLARGAIGHQEAVNIDMARIGAQGLASTSFLGDANDFALALNVMIPFAFFFFLYTKSKGLKGLLLLSLVIYVGGVAVTFSRGGFLALMAMGAAALWYSKRIMLGLVLLTVVGLGMAVYAPAHYYDRMKTSTEVEEGDTSYGRLQLWKAGLYMLAENPFTGVGLGAYPSAYGKVYSKYVHHYTHKWHVAHSSYITMAAELGLGGILLYLYIIYLIFKQNAGIRRSLAAADKKDSFLYATSSALTISLVAFSVGSAFLTACYYPHIYLLLSLTVAVGEMAREEVAAIPAGMPLNQAVSIGKIAA